MNICVWSGSSFEKQYASYHLMEGIILALLDEGHEVWLLQAKWFDGAIPKSLCDKEHLHILNVQQKKAEKNNFIVRYLSSINYYRISSKVIRRIPKLDVIFLQSNNSACFPVCFAKKYKVPIVYNVQDIFPENAMAVDMIKKKSILGCVMKRLQGYAYKNADLIITISEDMKNTIVTKYGIAKKKVEVAYNWGHVEGKSLENRFLLEYPKMDDEFRIVYAGNLGKMQNVELILETAELFREQKQIKFYIIGNGVVEEKLKQMAEEKKLNNIYFLPMQPPELAQDIYDSADINLITLHKEVIYTALPSKTADCLAAEKPVIFCIDKESVFAETLKEYNILVSSPVNPDELKRQILNVMKNGYKGELQKCLQIIFFKEKSLQTYCSCIKKIIES